MFDYMLGFYVLIAFYIGFLFDGWLEYMKKMKECDKCHGKGYVKKN